MKRKNKKERERGIKKETIRKRREKQIYRMIYKEINKNEERKNLTKRKRVRGIVQKRCVFALDTHIVFG